MAIGEPPLCAHTMQYNAGAPFWQSSSQGWICPKCSRVWAYYTHECKPCNDEVAAGQVSSDTTVNIVFEAVVDKEAFGDMLLEALRDETKRTS